MAEITKQTKTAAKAKPDEPKKIEGALDEKQLETVTGGKGIANACATGQHIKDATITH